MNKYLILIAFVFIFSSCARSCTSFNHSFQTGPRSYEVIMYSGGDTVFYDKFRAIVNNSNGSDGIFYFKNDTLIEVSGDYILKSIK